jgi:palmitoyltransferase
VLTIANNAAGNFPLNLINFKLQRNTIWTKLTPTLLLRCIPKMDHHCPWTSNCVSHNTFPHFLRFVYYTVISLFILAYHLSRRLYAVYEARNLPAYLGPSIWALVHLMILGLVTALLLFALCILLVNATQSLFTNTTMIESWEIERHEALVEKARYLGGYVHGPGGRRIRMKKQEFPYDIGVWKNLVQAMGGDNILAWILPFGGGPENKSGWGPWEENGFEDEGTTWPPVDPDKLPRTPPQIPNERGNSAFIHGDDDEVQAFKKRQLEDYKRWETMRNNGPRVGLKLKSSTAPVTSKHGESSEEEDVDEGDEEWEEGMDGKLGWTNSDGDRLRDYGVDEEAEMIVEDDIPLGELLRRRQTIASKQE